MYRKRFGFTNHPFAKDAHGDTFFDGSPGYGRLKANFKQLIDDPGLAIVTAEPGTGKTAALRNLCAQLPRPDYQVVYLYDTAVSPLDLYRALAIELGVKPSHRRSQLWRDIKNAIVHMVDERASMPVIIIDEAHHLSDKFLLDLSGFLNFAFDSRDLFTVWLAAHTSFAKRFKMQIHDALRSRSVVQVHLEAYDRETFAAFIDHGLRAVGATQKLLSDPALEQLFRTSRGLPRVAAKLSRAALRLAHERNQQFVDERTMDDALASIAAPTIT